MPNLLENFIIKRVAVHEIFKREEAGAVPPQMNDHLTELELRGVVELQARVVDAVGHNSHSIQMDVVKTDDNSVFSIVKPMLETNIDDDGFISVSQHLVTRLSESQFSQIIPGGAVIIFEGTTGTDCRRCIGIIKADKFAGFAISSDGGEAIMEFLSNLLLAPQQKLYKVALLVRHGHEIPLTPNDISLLVFDSNNNKSASNGSASYFYDTFLGCAYQRNNDVLTRDFYNYTKEYITKKSTLSGQDKVDTMSALYVYLKTRTENTLNIGEFARTYIREPIARDAYVSYMAEKRMPANDIPRDLSLIATKLKKRRIKFSNSVDIYAPVDDFRDNVTILDSNDTETTLLIKGVIKTEV